MTNEKIILQLEKGYDIKNPQLAQVLTNIENNGVTKGEFTEAMGTKADLVGGKVPAEQLPSYVDDVINFWNITTGVNPISTIINNVDYTNRMWFITKSTSSGSIGIKYPNKFIDFGANTSEDDWTIIEPEEGKIYIKIGSGNDQNHSFRWSGIALIDLDKDWSDQINELKVKTITVYLGDIKDPLDLSKFQNTSVFSTIYIYLNQRARYPLINLRWRYNSADYSSPIIDVDPVERSFRIYNQGYLQTYKVLKEDDNYSLVRVNNIPEFVSLDYSQINVALSDDLIERLKNAAGVIINDDQAYPNARNVYISSMKSDDYLFFTTTKNVSVSETSIVFEILIVNLKTNQLALNIRRYTLPYGAYSQFGFTSKSSNAVNQEVARLVNMNSCYITPSDLNKVHSGDKLENIKNATFLILDEGDGKTKIFTRGYASTTIIYYNCINTGESMKYILLKLNSNTLSSIENVYFDDTVFINYRKEGGTKISKYSMYKELAAQLTVNTYVINSSILNTTITDTNIREGISKADVLIIEDSTNNSYTVCIKGFVSDNKIYFFNLKNTNADNITAVRTSFNTTTNLLNSQDVYLQSAFNAYKLGGGTKYTTESAFNTALAAAIDAYTPTI